MGGIPTQEAAAAIEAAATAPLRLYVWEKVLYDYTPGAMWALARSPEHARELIRAKDRAVIEEDLAKKPNIVLEPEGFVVWGGS